MYQQSWVGALATLPVDGPALGTYTTAKSVFGVTTDGAGRRATTPGGADGLWVVGRVLRMTAQLDVSNIVTTPGTISFELRSGPTSNIVAATSGALQLSTTAHT